VTHTDAQANTEAEADTLITPLETGGRQRPGVAIYGLKQETVPEVIIIASNASS